MDERLSDEIEALEAILMDDVTIQYNKDTNSPEMIQTVVFPSTGEDAQQQYVCITLQVWLTDGYPDEAPVVKLRNSRGLDDSVLEIIEKEVDNKMKQCLGQPVVFELIEVVREHLTVSNLPSGQCVICLYGFREGDLFTKTACYHYFHSHCLACHLVAAERNHKEEQDKLPAWQRRQQNDFKAHCPVCREHIACDLSALLLATPPLEVETAQQFELTAELRALQGKMSELYLRQQSKGGIIDIEAEQNKLLLTTAADGTPADGGEGEGEGEGANEILADSGAAHTATATDHQQNNTEATNTAAATNKNANKNYYKGGHYRNYRGGGGGGGGYQKGRGGGGNQSRRNNHHHHQHQHRSQHQQQGGGGDGTARQPAGNPCASTDR